MREVVVIGAGLHPFGRFPELSYQALGRKAIADALKDAAAPFKDIEVAYVGRVLAGMGAGLSVVSEMGQTGIPVINVENACATASTAFASTADGSGPTGSPRIPSRPYRSRSRRTGLTRAGSHPTARRARSTAVGAMVA